MNKTTLGNEDENNLLNALKTIKNPADIGTVIMYYIVNNYSQEERMDIIRAILNRLSTDFLIHELPEGELEGIRKIIDRI